MATFGELAMIMSAAICATGVWAQSQMAITAESEPDGQQVVHSDRVGQRVNVKPVVEVEAALTAEWQARFAQRDAKANQQKAEWDAGNRDTRKTGEVPLSWRCAAVDLREAKIAERAAEEGLDLRHYRVTSSSPYSGYLPQYDMVTRCNAIDIDTGEEFSFIQPGAEIDGRSYALCGAPPHCRILGTYTAAFEAIDLPIQLVLNSHSAVVETSIKHNCDVGAPQ